MLIWEVPIARKQETVRDPENNNESGEGEIWLFVCLLVKAPEKVNFLTVVHDCRHDKIPEAGVNGPNKNISENLEKTRAHPSPETFLLSLFYDPTVKLSAL